MRIDEIDEEILLALKDGEKTLEDIGALVKSPRVAKRRIQKLLKYGFVKRIRRGIYGLDSKGKRYIEKRTLSDKALSIGQDLWQKVSTFIIDKVPSEVYQAVVRLTLSEMRAKQSELFTNLKNQFSAGWSGPLLAGKPKAIKTPVGEVICKIVGLDPEEQKFPITGTKSEFGVPHQNEGGVWKYRPSPWHKEPIAIIDDWHRIINKDARDTALSLARGNRTFKRYGEKFTNQVVPFIALNTHTNTIPETTEKIIKEIGEEDVKRLIVVNVDYLAPYLEDVAILTREMLRGVPRLNFKAFPIKKKELIDKEFNFMCHLLKESTKEKKGEFFDERSVEILILGRHALAKNRDIIGTIYQTCWDRLLCLETLEVTKEGWRESFRKKWKEYVSIEQPKVLEEVKKEEKREEERERKIKKAKERGVQQEAEQLKKRRSFQKSRDSLIAKLKDLRDNLPRKKRWENKFFSFRQDIGRLVEEIGRIRDPQKLEKYRLIYPEVEKEQKEIKDYEKLLILRLKKLGVRTEHIQEGKEIFIGLASETTNAKDIESLDSIKLRVEATNETFNDEISSLEERQQEKRREAEEKRREQEKNKKLKVIQNKKNEILEKSRTDVFQSKYLTSQQKAQLDILQNHQERKKAPVSDITSFLNDLGLIKEVNPILEELEEDHLPEPDASIRIAVTSIAALVSKRYREAVRSDWVYRGVDGESYLLDYFNTWDKALPLIQARIHQIKKIAIQNRKNKLAEERNNLDKLEQSLIIGTWLPPG